MELFHLQCYNRLSPASVMKNTMHCGVLEILQFVCSFLLMSRFSCLNLQFTRADGTKPSWLCQGHSSRAPYHASHWQEAVAGLQAQCSWPNPTSRGGSHWAPQHQLQLSVSTQREDLRQVPHFHSCWHYGCHCWKQRVWKIDYHLLDWAILWPHHRYNISPSLSNGFFNPSLTS